MQHAETKVAWKADEKLHRPQKDVQTGFPVRTWSGTGRKEKVGVCDIAIVAFPKESVRKCVMRRASFPSCPHFIFRGH